MAISLHTYSNTLMTTEQMWHRNECDRINKSHLSNRPHFTRNMMQKEHANIFLNSLKSCHIVLQILSKLKDLACNWSFDLNRAEAYLTIDESWAYFQRSNSILDPFDSVTLENKSFAVNCSNEFNKWIIIDGHKWFVWCRQYGIFHK